VTERAIEVSKRVFVGAYNEGFTHAGNLAYLSLVTLFPFFIVATAVARLVGRTGDGLQAVAAFLRTLPPDVAELLRPAILEVLQVRSGSLLWFGAIVGLWTATSFTETIRDILRRAYGTQFSAPFWEYRLISLAFILGAVLLLMIAFAASVMMASMEKLILAKIPEFADVAGLIQIYRIIPALALYGTIYAIFAVLTPSRYRKKTCRKWPGALLVTLWWLGTAELLPEAIALAGGYDLTYGSLAGVMIALLFFFVIGLGVVMGAELNAALAETDAVALKGETFAGPFSDSLEIEEPAPGEDVTTHNGGSAEL
jgi:membrane protein